MSAGAKTVSEWLDQMLVVGAVLVALVYLVWRAHARSPGGDCCTESWQGVRVKGAWRRLRSKAPEAWRPAAARHARKGE
jgi:hypothetical protein